MTPTTFPVTAIQAVPSNLARALSSVMASLQPWQRSHEAMVAPDASTKPLTMQAARHSLLGTTTLVKLQKLLFHEGPRP
jgi:hypothetical protein